MLACYKAHSGEELCHLYHKKGVKKRNGLYSVGSTLSLWKKGLRHGHAVVFQFLAESKMTNTCLVNMMQPPQMRQLALHKETAKLSGDNKISLPELPGDSRELLQQGQEIVLYMHIISC